MYFNNTQAKIHLLKENKHHKKKSNHTITVWQLSLLCSVIYKHHINAMDNKKALPSHNTHFH